MYPIENIILKIIKKYFAEYLKKSYGINYLNDEWKKIISSSSLHIIPLNSEYISSFSLDYENKIRQISNLYNFNNPN